MEADIVSARIAAILSENAFTFSVPQYVGIHKRLFEGIYGHAGKIRDYNISKKEWVLDGESVHYGNALELRELLEYDIRTEKEYEYSHEGLSEIISHLAKGLFLKRSFSMIRKTPLQKQINHLLCGWLRLL